MSKTNGNILSANEISTFCAQLSMIIKSGIPVGDGLAIMQEDVHNSDGKEILSVIQSHAELGEPLYLCLSATNKFPNYLINMVEIGERSGKLDDVFDSLCNYYEREEGISKSIKSAVTYPLVMIVIMLLVIGVLVTQVLPVFEQVFTQLGSQMSPFSQSIMNIGTAVGRYSYIIVIIAAVLVALFYILKATDAGRKVISRFKGSFFLTKKLSQKIASGRFASAMSLMLSSGLETEEALNMVENLVDNVYIRDKIILCKNSIDEGSSFSDALAKSGIFSGVYTQMVVVGFKTGSVDTVMRKLADRYEEETDTQINGMISVLEPTLVAALSIVVGMILLSVMLPLMGIMSSIG